MGHYWDVVRASVAAQREEKAKPKRNRHEREFQPAAIEIMETPASPVGRFLAFLIIAFAISAITWSFIGRIDIFASLQGKIVPTGQVKVIEPLITATVSAIHVKEGQKVKAGDLLIEFDPTEQTADRTRLAEDLTAARLIESRLVFTHKAALAGILPQDVEFLVPAGTPPNLAALHTRLMRNSLSAYYAELNSLKSEIGQRGFQRKRFENSIVERKKLVAVMTERIEMYNSLAKEGAGTRARYLEGAQLLYEQRADLVSDEGRLYEIDAEMRSLALKGLERKAAFLEKIITEQAENESRITSLRQELRKAKKREDQSRLYAPVSGTVQQLVVYTLGDVVASGQQLMIIVPDNVGLQVEAFLLNRDKGFVRVGQKVKVKLESFPFTKYGIIDGEVMDVSNDAIDQNAAANSAAGAQQASAPAGALVFPVRIKLAREDIRADGRTVALTPGMSLTAEVKTGNRRVIEFLLSPLLRWQDEALRER